MSSHSASKAFCAMRCCHYLAIASQIASDDLPDVPPTFFAAIGDDFTSDFFSICEQLVKASDSSATVKPLLSFLLKMRSLGLYEAPKSMPDVDKGQKIAKKLDDKEALLQFTAAQLAQRAAVLKSKQAKLAAHDEELSELAAQLERTASEQSQSLDDLRKVSRSLRLLSQSGETLGTTSTTPPPLARSSSTEDGAGGPLRLSGRAASKRRSGSLLSLLETAGVSTASSTSAHAGSSAPRRLASSTSSARRSASRASLLHSASGENILSPGGAAESDERASPEPVLSGVERLSCVLLLLHGAELLVPTDAIVIMCEQSQMSIAEVAEALQNYRRRFGRFADSGGD